jgi:hypothetical protein
MRGWALGALFCVCAAVAPAQVGEFALSGGVSRFGSTSLGTLGSPSDPKVTLSDGFRLTLRFALNPYRFFGHEFGYSYNRSHLKAGGSQPLDLSVPLHQGFYDFLIYATPEGSHVRPFAAGGAQFSSFFPPGASVYYGNQVTKFGINYGGGIKFRVGSIWGVRLDVREYNTGKPFNLPNQSGRLSQLEVSGGISFNF